MPFQSEIFLTVSGFLFPKINHLKFKKEKIAESRVLANKIIANIGTFSPTK